MFDQGWILNRETLALKKTHTTPAFTENVVVSQSRAWLRAKVLNVRFNVNLKVSVRLLEKARHTHLPECANISLTPPFLTGYMLLHWW